MILSFLFCTVTTLVALLVMGYFFLLMVSKEHAGISLTQVMKGFGTTIKVLFNVLLRVLKVAFKDASKLMEVILESTKSK